MNKVGKLTVIVGSMFSGKSTELKRQGKRHELAQKVVAYFKPNIDDRYVPTAITTHDGTYVDAYVVKKSQEIVGVVDQMEQQVGFVSVVCIDEVQFFDDEIVNAVKALLVHGTDVIVAGLDLDRFARPFGKVPELLAYAEEVVKVHAVCSDCGNDSWISYSDTQDQNQVVVGEKDIYRPLCRDCYFKIGGTM